MKKKYIIYLLSFLIPIILMNIIFAIKGVTPFGNIMATTKDYYSQISAFLYQLKHGTNIYSFSFVNGLGIPFVGNFYNYLSSPLNVFILFFNDNTMPVFFSEILALKIGFSSLTMCIFLKNKFNKIEYYLLPFCLLYCFMIYVQAYSFCIMWMDAIILLPLIILGIENIVNKKQNILYICSLSLLLFSNYYMGAFVCWFSVLYFIMYLFYKTKIKDAKLTLKSILIFIYSSLLSGGIVAFALIPTYFVLKQTSATGYIFLPDPATYYFQLNKVNYLVSFLSGVEGQSLYYTSNAFPNVSCGIIISLLTIYFIFNKSIKINTKMTYLLMMGIISIGFIFGPFDYLLNFLHITNDIPWRYSYFISFLMIITSFYSFITLDKTKLLSFSIITIISLIGVFVIYHFQFEFISKGMVLFNLILISLLYIIFILYIRNRVLLSRVLFIIITIVSILLPMIYNVKFEYTVDDYFFNLSDLKKEIDSKNDDSFYRMEIDRDANDKRFNISSIMNYNGATGFSSLNKESVAEFFLRNGYYSNFINMYIYDNRNIFISKMLGIKYFYKNNELLMDDNVSVGYAVSKETKDIKLTMNLFNNYNQLVTNMTGINDAYERINYKSKTVTYINDKSMYIKYEFNSPDDIYIYLTNGVLLYFNDKVYCYNADICMNHYQDIILNNNGMFEVSYVKGGYLDNNREVIIGVPVDFDDNDFIAFSINDNMNDAIDELTNERLENVTYKNNVLNATIELSEDSLIFTSIPDDEGLKVYVDGKEVRKELLIDSFLGFNCTKGYHEIKIIYKNPYLNKSIIISVFSALVMASIIVIKHCKKKNNKLK